MREFFRERGANLLLLFAVALFLYGVGGGRFSLRDGKMALWLLGVFLTVGWSAFQASRYSVRYILSKLSLCGFPALVLGVLLSAGMTIGAAALIMNFEGSFTDKSFALPFSVGLVCGVIGGAFGAMEATNKSEARRAQ